MTPNVLSKEEFMKRYMEDKRKKEYFEKKSVDNYFYDSINRCKKRGKKK